MAMGYGPATGCTLHTADGTVKSTAGKVFGVYIRGISNATDVILRDGGSGGTEKARFRAPASGSGSYHLPIPIEFNTDIYIELTGS